MTRLSLNRRTFLQSAAAVSVVAASGARAQESWPTRTVKIIVPYPAGGNADVVARIVAQALQDELHESFVVENKAGADGDIGVSEVIH